AFSGGTSATTDAAAARLVTRPVMDLRKVFVLSGFIAVDCIRDR
ncbi:MAG: hypothetical protein ACI9NC_002871, partial [Verrucomicrobiales bacterium]